MAKLYLGLGTNMGNKTDNLNSALCELTNLFGLPVKCSEYYYSKPWGFSSENDFVNLVVEYNTDLNSFEILNLTQQIEKKLGRKTKTDTAYTDRLIDIDILLYDDNIINHALLTVPHPLITERDFVLNPLAEIAPDFIHPVLKKTIQELKEMSRSKL